MAGPDEQWRCFVACELTPELRQALTPALDAVAALGRVVRSAPPSGIHLTLHFLGSVAVSRIEALAAAMAPVIAAARPFVVEVQGIGAFPHRRQPQVLFAAVTGPSLDSLRDLHAGLGQVIARNGLTVEDRPFRPHLTLGRVRPPVPLPVRRSLTGLIDTWASTPFGELPIDAVHLIRSQLGNGPPQYTSVHRFGLGG